MDRACGSFVTEEQLSGLSAALTLLVLLQTSKQENTMPMRAQRTPMQAILITALHSLSLIGVLTLHNQHLKHESRFRVKNQHKPKQTA
jgi:preprotein translocase subunit SecG